MTLVEIRPFERSGAILCRNVALQCLYTDGFQILKRLLHNDDWVSIAIHYKQNLCIKATATLDISSKNANYNLNLY